MVFLIEEHIGSCGIHMERVREFESLKGVAEMLRGEKLIGRTFIGAQNCGGTGRDIYMEKGEAHFLSNGKPL